MFKLIKKIFVHKIILAIVVLAVVAASYLGFTKFNSGTQTEINYITDVVKKGNIIVSVSGTGQVSASNQVDVNPEVSGKVVYISVVKNQEVKSGQIIAQLDASDALKSVRDAKTSLESAKLSLEKVVQPANELSVSKAENSLEQAIQTKNQTEKKLIKSYEDGFNNVSDAFLDLPSLMANLDDIIFGNDFSSDQWNQWNINYYETRIKQYLDYDEYAKVDNYLNKVLDSYKKARNNYSQNFEDYKNISRYSEVEKIENLIDQTYSTLGDISEAIKNTKNLIDFFEDLLTTNNVKIPSITTSHQNDIASYTGIINSHLSTILSSRNNIDNYQEDIINAVRNIEERQGELDELLAGADPLDVRSQNISIQQKEDALLDAQQKLADYSIRAPFDGVIAELNIEKGQSVSSGTSVATLITKQHLAEISLNEIDAAKIKVGQKATITFDAIENLSISGEVIEIDTLGTVSSGVVSYGVKVVFDIQDERIKPGMSLSVNIIIDSKLGVLSVPVSAVKESGSASYVEILVEDKPQMKNVATGLSNDITVEIIEGISEGEQVITQTITGSSSISKTNTNTSAGSNNNVMRGVMQLEGGGGPPR